MITIVVFISQLYLLINGEMILDHPKPKTYKNNLFRIFEKHLDPGQVNFCINCDELIHNIIPQTVPVVILNEKCKRINWPAYNKVDTYIVDLTRGTREKLEFMRRNPGWNPRAKFFIVYNNKNVGFLLRVLVSKYIVNVVIFSTPDNKTLTIRTYDPFKHGELRPKTLKAITIATINDTNKDFDLQLDLFPNKYPKTWNNITVNTVLVCSPPYVMHPPGFELIGLDLLNLRLAARRIGIKINHSPYLLNYFGDKGNDDNYNFAFGELQKRKFDVALGAFPASFPEYVDFDMAYPVMEDYLVMVVLIAPIKNRWKCIIDIFEKPVWTSFLVSVLLMTIIFHIISKNRTNYSPSMSFLICLGCVLKICVPKIPKSKSQRFLLMFWIVFCFLTDAYFESHLQGAFNNVQREHQINSFEEIKDTRMKVAVNKKYLQLFTNEGTEIDRFVARNHFEHHFPLNVINESIAAIVLERFMKYYIAFHHVDSTVHIVTKKLMFCPLTMYFTKGFPLFDAIQKSFHDHRAIGCVEKLYRFGKHSDQVMNYKHGITWKINPLNLDELKYLVWMLLGGLSFSCVVFLFEILGHKFM